MEELSTVFSIDVTRSDFSKTGECTWTISFLEDLTGSHRGDVPPFIVLSSLSSGTEILPSITVSEVRKGTFKEVQKISISAGGEKVDPLSSFKLMFNGMTTSDILALPIGGITCLGSTVSKQVITTSTEDTTSQGGDNTVSILTTFVLSYHEFNTNPIAANRESCENTASIISDELMLLAPLKQVSVSGTDSGADDGGCSWFVTLTSVTGNPELLKGENINFALKT